MIIAGIQKTSLIDYPGKICTTIFTRGCNFSCGFCHNPELVIPKKYNKPISNDIFFDFIEKRKRLLDAVTICGGEPTIHKNLPQFIKKIKNLGYLVKLDTNGSNPQAIKELIDNRLVDYIAMDIKNSFDKYLLTTNKKIHLDNIKKSINIIQNSKIEFEFRTTVVPGLHNQNDIQEIGKAFRGLKKFYIQNFRPGKTVNDNFSTITPFDQETLNVFKKTLEKYVKDVYIR